MQERGVQMQAEQLPISAIVRSPLLAIRWQLPDNKTRRVQFRFKSSADYDTAYSHLHRLGLRMSGPSPFPAQSPERASKCKPTPSPTAVAYPEQHPMGATFQGGPSCPPSRLTDISNRPYTALNAPTSLESQIQEAAHTRPSSAATSYARPGEERNPFSSSLAPPVHFAWPDSATSDILGRAYNDLSLSSHKRAMPTIEEVPRTSSERPDTASSMLFNRPDTAEALPPRRELPFPRLSAPLSSGSDTARPSSRPSTGLMGPPPLPARVAGLRPSSSRGAHKEPDLPPLPQPTVISKPAPRLQPMQKAPRTPDQDENAPLRAKTSPYDGVGNLSPLNSSSPFSPLLSQRSSSSTARPMSQPLRSLSSAARNLQPPMSHQGPISTASGATYQNQSAAGTASALDPSSDDSLAAYAMQSEEERRAALNEFVFRHLESDDFLTLVEDMETCWARAAFGMR
ncbi:hypothetical protein BDW02DRAFT_571434 [Decorospora gaudefroyi]|uniref:Uncharacterized protein n=1 Tax=Decorospora gaudefroyi TaxID=184978 RepID=A0A6A5KB96_9PLEO|nr:hypothetical protein BDW02DRAFT_571434 [Decorospora gaudefroyi]